jgi:hypothetical protein
MVGKGEKKNWGKTGRSQERPSKETAALEGPISITLWMGEQAKH